MGGGPGEGGRPTQGSTGPVGGPEAGLKRGPSGSPKGPRAPGSSLRMSAQQRALLSLALWCTLQNVWEKHNYTSIIKG